MVLGAFVILVIQASPLLWLPTPAGFFGPPRSIPWLLFLIALPLFLAVLVWQRQRWAFMGAVMYGTVGLAIDIATILQRPANAAVLEPQGAMMLVECLMYLVLIVYGGRGLLDVRQDGRPP
jgi:hypothetical protein